jgi:MFS family permease
VFQTFDRGRGLALGAVSAFTGLGVAVIPVVDSWLIGAWGWRNAFAVGGGTVLLAALINLFLLRGVSSNRPTATDANSQALAVVLRDSLSVLAMDSTFWNIVGLFFLLAVLANAMPLHLPLILQQRGAAPPLQALSLTVLGVTMIVARPMMGLVLDWLPIRWVLAIMVAGPLAGVLILLAGSGTSGALVSAAGFGLTIGGEIVCLSYIICRAFPPERFGSTYGWGMLALALGAGAGPIAVSALVKVGGGYEAPLIMMVVAGALALAICFFFIDSRFRFVTPGLVQQGV